MKPHQLASTATRQEQSGFTLTELAVLLAVIGVLGCLLLAATLRNSRLVKRVQCAANLQQFALVTHLYASEQRDRLPEMSSGTWAWDVPISITSALQDRGMERKHFYCPGTAPRFNDNYNFLSLPQ
jgi:type II secretory pathway pseudopilin PulG